MAASNTPAPKVRTVTGFGINDFRGFNSSATTEFFFEGQRLVGTPDASLIGLGSRVNVRLAANANQNLTEGGVDQVFT